jgi:hypothetical protein
VIPVTFFNIVVSLPCTETRYASNPTSTSLPVGLAVNSKFLCIENKYLIYCLQTI